MRVVRTSSACRQLVRYRYHYTDTVTAETLAELSETSMDTVEELIANGILQPVTTSSQGTRFQVRDVRIVRQAIRLHRDLDVSWVSMPVVMDLLERIEELERDLRSRRVRPRPRRRMVRRLL